MRGQDMVSVLKGVDNQKEKKHRKTHISRRFPSKYPTIRAFRG